LPLNISNKNASLPGKSLTNCPAIFPAIPKEGVMFIIANNITTRNASVNHIFNQAKESNWAKNQQAITGLQEIASQCTDAGADALEIDLQQHHDFPEGMEFAVNTVQEVTDRQLCLSSNNPEAIEAGLKACKRPPIVNYISVTEASLKNTLSAIGKYNAEAVLLVSEPMSPTDVREMLSKAAVLIGAANESGIPNERLLIDPGLIHISHDLGQRHLQEVMEFLKALPQATDPPVRSTCWLSNISSGISGELRATVEATLLPMLASLGLSSVFVDITCKEIVRAIRLIKVFYNETVYSDAYIEG
jgi:cobalamin-dependent methionine synthase I